MHRILAINPGSTSTKIGIFEDETLVKEITLRHSNEELLANQGEKEFQFRKEVIEATLRAENYDLKTFSAIACRGGGAMKPCQSGTYLVNDAIKYDCIHYDVPHPSNLAPLIGDALAKEFNLKAYVTDPPTVFEAPEIATVSGSPLVQRKLRFHALNHKAIAKKFCKDNNLNYNEVDVIVAHLGGGASIAMHSKGRVIDVTDGIDEGPFTPERSGQLPTRQIIDMCFSGKYTFKQMADTTRGNTGFQGYLGTNDMRDVLKMVDAGDAKAKFYVDAFVYQVAKDIGSMATTVQGKVQAILLTGGISYSKLVTDAIRARVEWIAPVVLYPGEAELQSLNQGALSILRGEEQLKEYK